MAPTTITSQPRAFRAYCVGHAKSGTASMAGLFQGNVRSSHEPERTELLKMILLEANVSMHRDEFVDYICHRDERLGLEFDSSWVNYFIIGHLVYAFPDAKFILLVRDCYTWVESIVNHMLTREIPADVREFMDWWFEPQNIRTKMKSSYSREISYFPWTAI